MVVPPLHLAALVAVAALVAHAPTGVHASAITENAVTPVGLVVPLGVEHPAFGDRPSPRMVRPVSPAQQNISRAEIFAEVAKNNSDSAGDATPVHGTVHGADTSRRRLEATNNDIQRLEHHFGQSLERNVHVLKQRYSSGTPQPIAWPGGYWPKYADSINYRWTDEPSPAEKYARAFGKNPRSFMDAVSNARGIDSHPTQKCRHDDDCKPLNDGSACGIRAGQETGHCIPMWYGICHAWAPAAILEPEPRCDVTKNGITFRPVDIKGLMTAVYDGAGVPTVFTGARYDGVSNDVDEYGRYIDPAERDLGAGYFHLAVTNIMGRFGKAFVLDVSPGYEVWNQPVRGYEIQEMHIMSIEDAAQHFFNVPRYPFNHDARKAAYVHMKFSWILESMDNHPLVPDHVDSFTRFHDYYYMLELDDHDNVIGGEWLWDSQGYHPDFLWFATQKPDMNAETSYGLKYRDILELLQASVACGAPPSDGSCGNENVGAQACPDGQYCQPWNPNQYQCRSVDAKCGRQETGVDFYGEDLATHQVNLPEECCAKCHETQGCKAYTFINYNADGKAYCYLKKGSGRRQANSGAVSAVIQSGGDSCAPHGGSCGNQWSGPQCCQSDEYCQPWNPDQYQCRKKPDQCGLPDVNVDYNGDDLAMHQVTLPEHCCDKCASTPGCKAYTFINYNADGKAYCYLKKGTGQKSTKVGAISAVLTNSNPSCDTPVWGSCGRAATGAQCCPQSQYCQPWDAGNYQCINTPDQCSRQLPTTDLYGDDLAQFFGIGPGECCAKCAETDGCKAYTYVNDNKPQPACYLKRGMGEQRYHASAVSAFLN
ncbi:hypothetical protein P43SY_009994 [Pythium insidiosum]|uniref:Apple domain-containing protein n=1 Tax=Pythium insidiosum TaxID=114742 RepID=A0AAD5Q983_PYTIN|nr:hypothetical protein P43SY_009994 [Pythium insidiosum]